MKTCILHIGTEKTGTTALQEWLYDNQSELSRRGVYLSKKLGAPNNRLFPVYFSRGLDEWAQVNKVRSAQEKDRFFRNFKADLGEEFRVALQDHEYIVVSSEHLHSRVTTRDEIMSIKTFLDTVFDRTLIVCYFRSQSEMALSLFSTSLKFGHTTSLDTFMEHVRPDTYFYNFESIADNWSGIFGKESCVFRIFDRGMLLHEDVRKDFLNILGLDYDMDELYFADTRANESLSRSMAAVFRVVNIVLPSLPDRQSFPRKATRLFNKSIKKIFHIFLSKTKRKIEYSNMTEVDARFMESNSRFFEKYFDGVCHF